MTANLQIQKAVPENAASLSRLACRSKAHWGYSDDFMRAAEDELSVSAADIESNHIHYYVVLVDQTLAGFYSLEDQQGDSIELGAMFVDPAFIGTGTGRALMDHAKTSATALGAKALIIQSDPNAERFYKAAGGRNTGSRESESIPGRFLPVLEIELSGE